MGLCAWKNIYFSSALLVPGLILNLISSEIDTSDHISLQKYPPHHCRVEMSTQSRKQNPKPTVDKMIGLGGVQTKMTVNPATSIVLY